jgi:Zn-dependent protease
VTRCARCGTELSPHALACPGCAALVHADRLKELATGADSATLDGDLFSARGQWLEAVALLPSGSQQHAVISNRIAELSRRIDETQGTGSWSKAAGDRTGLWWRVGAGALTVVVLLATKFKFLMLGLTKLSTFTSMFAFFGVYWSLYGWPLALGLVVSIYIHEMGHVAMLRRLGIEAGAPLFIPGVGAFVMLKGHVTDPLSDAKIGLAGPVWGLGAGLAALAMHGLTGADIWFAIAQLTALLNLFNLIPIWQLDGSRGLQPLSKVERWLLVAAMAAALLVTGQRLLIIVGGVAVWRAFRSEAGPGSPRILATFVALIWALALLAPRFG